MAEWAYPSIEKDYSVEELQYIIDFYSSPTGRTLVEKMPIMTQQLMSHLPEYLQQPTPKIRDTAMQAATEKNYKLKF
jgi:hypothetical protein